MDHGWQGNMTLMGNATDLTMAATSGNSTFQVINEFKFLAARSIRTSTIILSVFNTVSAFATAAGILFDCYLKAKRSGPRPNQKYVLKVLLREPLEVNIFRCVRGPETFPFILSLGITAQGIIFAVAQSYGLDGLFKAGCSLISQFMWPADKILDDRNFRASWRFQNGLLPRSSCFIKHPMNGGSTSSLTLATIASVVANLSGLLTGGLYLFLRSSTISTIGPRDKVSEYERQKLKYNIRLQGPDAMELDGPIVQRAPSARSLRERGSRDTLVAAEKGNSIDVGHNTNPLNANPFNVHDLDSRNSYAVFGSAEATPRVPEPTAQMPTATTARPRSRRPSTSYSLFPSDQQQQQQQQQQPSFNSATLLPSTTYSPESTVAGLPEPGFLFVPGSASTLQPPSRLGPDGFRRHRRDSSLASHATVQIGLRFSNVDDIGPMTGKSSMEAERVHTLDCPDRAPPSDFFLRPSPLAREQQRAESVVSDMADADAYTDDGSERPLTLDTAVASDILKSLPPLPAQPSPTTQRASGPTLSPSVYTPPGTAITTPTRGRLASPGGVGFGVPRRTNTTPEPSVTVPAPLRIRGYSNAEKGSGRGEWI
ncbi:hypothetical protein SLS62_003203 [Diatrype stigma]|uniref:Uncharacterized protein n=1 Tax=Diatrype stigma TaxID=117547 RepID=A0AAN9V5F9_9PEZI